MNAAKEFDAAIIGAGPAGMAAAVELNRAGANVVVLDENASVGGQIYRSVTSSPLRTNSDLLGQDYWSGRKLAEQFLATNVQRVASANVWAVSQHTASSAPASFEIGYSVDSQANLLHAKHVLLATGAQERPMPISGWTLPGVITAGAAQTLLKTTAVVPTGRLVLAGCGPLLYLLAWQYLNANVKIDALLDTTPKGRLPSLWPYAFDFLRSPYFLKGLRLVREVSSKVRVVKHVTELVAEGQDKLASVSFSVGSAQETLTADHLILHQGVIPNINLAQAIGVSLTWSETLKCWEPVCDEWGNTNVERIHVAGDAAGIAGAWAAEARGRVCAVEIAHQLGMMSDEQRDTQTRVFRQAYKNATRGREFFDRLFQPVESFRRPKGDTVVCRCEEISAQQVRETVGIGCAGPNQMKSYLRCGMGPCQGRFCAVTVTELIAEERGVSEAEVGHYRLRFPTKPLTLGELASLPQTDESISAVVRLKKPV